MNKQLKINKRHENNSKQQLVSILNYLNAVHLHKETVIYNDGDSVHGVRISTASCLFQDRKYHRDVMNTHIL